ncbi:MAG: hypothetical protein J2P19_12590, partial [Pseudonocardia sp.]|nr:hypothetical protein [Pseudonocardia sp.]
TGVYLFVALTWLESITEPILYTAALAFSAYGIHWFALGWNRYQGNDARPNGFMSIAFTILSILGLVVFFAAGAWPVGILFAGLTAVYICEFFASFNLGGHVASPTPGADTPTSQTSTDAMSIGAAAAATPTTNLAQRALGLAHTVTGVWLMYLTFATTLDISLHYHLPGG